MNGLTNLTKIATEKQIKRDGTQSHSQADSLPGIFPPLQKSTGGAGCRDRNSARRTWVWGLMGSFSNLSLGKVAGHGSTCFTIKWSSWKSSGLGLKSPHQDVTKEAVVTLKVSPTVIGWGSCLFKESPLTFDFPVVSWDARQEKNN